MSANVLVVLSASETSHWKACAPGQMLNEGDYIQGIFTYLNPDAKFLAKPVSDIRGVLRAPNQGISSQSTVKSLYAKANL